jgi:hypothetical protein
MRMGGSETTMTKRKGGKMVGANKGATGSEVM